MNTINAALNKSSKLHCDISTHKCHTESVFGALLNYPSLVRCPAQGCSLLWHLVGMALCFCMGWTLNLVPLSCGTLENVLVLYSL